MRSHQPAFAGSHVPHHSGRTDPCWFADVRLSEHEPLTRSLDTDICIAGAGIAGLTTAYLLLKAGRRVVVIDHGPIGGGDTGRTSAHLSSILDNRFMNIRRMHGDSAARIMYLSHCAAIDKIWQISRDEEFDCEFARLGAYLLLGRNQDAALLDQELEAALALGVEGVKRVEHVEGSRAGPALRFEHQARFHPAKYLAGLARAVTQLGGSIYCGSRVVDMNGDGPATVRTLDGHTVTASAAVCATNAPSVINNWTGIYTKQSAYRTYMVGLEVGDASIADALYWDFEDPYHYVRLHHGLALVGGEDHKTGQQGDITPADRLDRLEDWARRRFHGLGVRAWQWSGQVNEPDDGAAFIGKVPTKGHERCFVITGDSGMGLTHGTLGAMLVSELIAGRSSPWAGVYDPARKPTAAIGEFLSDNLNAAAQLRDYLLPGELKSEDSIPPDSGAIIRHGLTKVAVYRSEDGALHRCSPVCTHLKALVRWNDLEKTWDCPCHGSRFTPKGSVITGPAVKDLARVQDLDEP